MGDPRQISVASDMTLSPVEVRVLRPADAGDDVLPLILLLHGGGGDASFLETMRPAIERAWERDTLPRVVVATPSAGRSFYLDYRDGSQRWESFVLGPLVEELRANHGATSDPRQTALAGISMGGMGALHLAFRRPRSFGVVCALEPGIEPVLDYRDIELRDRFWRPEALMEEIYGRPVDEAYWRANHPPLIAIENADEIRASGLAIYIECGDEDSFGLHRGTEFLHRVLWDHEIRHEYRNVRGADHLGRTLGPRFADAFRFLNEALRPPGPDATLAPFHAVIAGLKRAAGMEA
jgi:S-formylglutathione hydrolase